MDNLQSKINAIIKATENDSFTLSMLNWNDVLEETKNQEFSEKWKQFRKECWGAQHKFHPQNSSVRRKCLIDVKNQMLFFLEAYGPASLVPRIGYTATATYQDFEIRAVFTHGKSSNWEPASNNHYKVTVKRGENSISFDFWASIAQPKISNGYDVLNAFYCFVSDAISGEETFENFCSELGYDADSRQAHKTWKACKKQLEKLYKIYDGDIYDLINELSDVAA